MLSCLIMKAGEVSGKKKNVFQNENKKYPECFKNQNKE